jgi:hypothetical protein
MLVEDETTWEAVSAFRLLYHLSWSWDGDAGLVFQERCSRID